MQENGILSLSPMLMIPMRLTGDSRVTAEYFASKVGLSEIKAELLLEQKVEILFKCNLKAEPSA